MRSDEGRAQKRQVQAKRVFSRYVAGVLQVCCGCVAVELVAVVDESLRDEHSTAPSCRRRAKDRNDCIWRLWVCESNNFSRN